MGLKLWSPDVGLMLGSPKECCCGRQLLRLPLLVNDVGRKKEEGREAGGVGLDCQRG